MSLSPCSFSSRRKWAVVDIGKQLLRVKKRGLISPANYTNFLLIIRYVT